MSAQVFAFRPFQSAAQQAKRAGVPPQKAIAEVREAQSRGEMGNHVAGKYRALAWRPNGAPPPKGAA